MNIKLDHEKWIDEIPRDWEILNLSKIIKYSELGENYKTTNLTSKNPVIKMVNIDRGKINLKKIDYLEDLSDLNSNLILKKGDFLFNTRNSIDLVGKVSTWDGSLGSATFNSNILRIFFKNNIHPDYMNFLFNSVFILDTLKLIAKGTTNVSAIYYKDLKEIKVSKPKFEEQKLISQYLYKKTKQIDSLIEKIEKKIELLEEQKTALINQYVTKGLDPNLEMKDSGIDWIGEIPKHWNLLTIKRILDNKNDSIRTGPFGSELKSTDFLEEGVKVYNQKTIYENDFSVGEIFISEEKFETLKSFETKEGDLLITTRGTIGKIAVVPQNAEKGVIHPCLIRLRLNNKIILREFLISYVNLSSFFLEEILYKSNSTTIEVIYSDTLKSIKIPIPPLKEQIIISNKIIKKNTLIKKLVKKYKDRINLIKEYRQSLISSAVTGKIKITEDML